MNIFVRGFCGATAAGLAFVGAYEAHKGPNVLTRPTAAMEKCAPYAATVSLQGVEIAGPCAPFDDTIRNYADMHHDKQPDPAVFKKAAVADTNASYRDTNTTAILAFEGGAVVLALIAAGKDMILPGQRPYEREYMEKTGTNTSLPVAQVS